MSSHKQVIPAPWPAGGHYSHAVSATGRLVFLAGQTADVPGPELSRLDIREQTRRCIERLGRLVAEAGGELSDIVKTTCFLADITDFAAFNDVYKNAFGDDPPARSTFQVGAFPAGLLVEIEAIAVVGG